VVAAVDDRDAEIAHGAIQAVADRAFAVPLGYAAVRHRISSCRIGILAQLASGPLGAARSPVARRVFRAAVGIIHERLTPRWGRGRVISPVGPTVVVLGVGKSTVGGGWCSGWAERVPEQRPAGGGAVHSVRGPWHNSARPVGSEITDAKYCRPPRRAAAAAVPPGRCDLRACGSQVRATVACSGEE